MSRLKGFNERKASLVHKPFPQALIRNEETRVNILSATCLATMDGNDIGAFAQQVFRSQR
jgi:hypothetical protein